METDKNILQEDSNPVEYSKAKLNECIEDIWNCLGGIHTQSVYSNSLEIALQKRNIPYVKDYKIPIIYEEKIVGNHTIDMLVNNNIIVNIITDSYYKKERIEKLKNMLKISNLSCAILFMFRSVDIGMEKTNDFLISDEISLDGSKQFLYKESISHKSDP